MCGWCRLELKWVFSLILECPQGNNEKLRVRGRVHVIDNRGNGAIYALVK